MLQGNELAEVNRAVTIEIGPMEEGSDLRFRVLLPPCDSRELTHRRRELREVEHAISVLVVLTEERFCLAQLIAA